MAEQDLVEKVRRLIDTTTTPDGTEICADVRARVIIETVLEEMRHRTVDRRELAFVDAIARANGIDLEQS